MNYQFEYFNTNNGVGLNIIFTDDARAQATKRIAFVSLKENRLYLAPVDFPKMEAEEMRVFMASLTHRLGELLSLAQSYQTVLTRQSHETQNFMDSWNNKYKQSA